jgi:hypothetical protein
MKVKMLRRKGKESENDGKKSRKEERKKEMKEGKNRENNTGMGGGKKIKRGGDYCLIYVVSLPASASVTSPIRRGAVNL